MIVGAYNAAGWRECPAGEGDHGCVAALRGTEIDDVTVLVRSPKDMNLIQISGLLRPLDLLHLS